MTKAEFIAWAAGVEAKFDAVAAAQVAYNDLVAEGEGHAEEVESAYNDLATASRELFNEMDTVKVQFPDFVDSTPPTIYSASPGGGGESVNQNIEVSFTFDSGMNEATLTNASLQLRDENGKPWPTTGNPTFVTGGDGSTTATLQLDGALTSLGYFRMWAGTACRDAAGNAMRDEYYPAAFRVAAWS